MADLTDRTELEITDVSPKFGTTKPRLDIMLSANPRNNEIPVHRISSNITFRFPESDKHIEGPIPQSTGPRIAEFGRRGSTFTIRVEFTHRELDEIERLRQGGDLVLELDVWILGQRNDDREEARFELKEELIDGEWMRILDAFDYHDKREVQLDLSVGGGQLRDQLDTAHAQIKGAQEKHDGGDYPAAIVECRRAIETLQTIEEVEDFVHDRKHRDLDDIMGTFRGRFAGAFAHSEDQTDITPARKRDSEFALNLTKACAKFISDALEEETE